MSMLFPNADLVPRVQGSARYKYPQPSSWTGLLGRLLSCSERARQRAALRGLADNPHLLADLGLTRDDALAQADKPFWQ